MEQIKERIRKAFEKSPKYELVEMPYIDCAEDPVTGPYIQKIIW
jgi:hypothetical protein